MRSAICCLAFTVGLLLVSPAPAFAGMPMVRLTDVAEMRIQSLSFFLMVFLVASALIQFIWNRLRGDFPKLPRLTYGKALGLVTLWGLLFVLVLTMISGARELLTPGAWEKVGLTYKLAKDAAPPPLPLVEETTEKERRQKLDNLRAALWEYARTHDGRFPSDRSAPGVPPEAWQAPHPASMQYVYIAKLTPDAGPQPLAAEPDIFGAYRFVLFANGAVCRMESSEAVQVLSAGVKP